MNSDLDVIRNRLMQLFKEEHHLDAEKIGFDTPLENLTIDSLDTVNLIFKVEEEFGCGIELGSSDKFVTVGDIIDRIAISLSKSQA